MIDRFLKKYLFFCCANCLFSLLIGIFFYIVGRTEFLSILGTVVNDFLLTASFYVPDALWAYALYFALSLFQNSFIATILTIGAGILWEVLQKTNLVNGTFDFFDIILYLIATLVAVIINKLWRKKYEKNNS